MIGRMKMRRNLKMKANSLSDSLENHKQALVKEADNFVPLDSVCRDQSSAEEQML